MYLSEDRIMEFKLVAGFLNYKVDFSSCDCHVTSVAISTLSHKDFQTVF